MDSQVFKYFQEISEIPRGSGNEKGISDYLVAFANRNCFEFIQDEALNVIIKKKATPGYESRPKLVLQAHMDMVCEKNAGKEHDFTKDPICLKMAGDMVYADGTTLGADNGTGMAMILALLEAKHVSHPDLEALFTTDEERGMVGAECLDPSNIQGRILINLDSDMEGKFDIKADVDGGGVAGQAGAVRLGIARALILAKPDLRTVLRRTGFLTRDPRMVERKKYGKPKARKRFQFSKR